MTLAPISRYGAVTDEVIAALRDLLGGGGMAMALWYGERQFAASNLTQGQFVAFFTAVFMMYGPAKKLSRVNANLQQAIAAVALCHAAGLA